MRRHETASDSPARAPELRLLREDGEAIPLVDPRGGPVVVALAPRWDAGAAKRREDAIRAELRGVGATLVIFEREGAWLLGADDPLERLTLAGAPHDGDAAMRLGITRRGEPWPARAVLLIDPSGRVRLCHVEREAGSDDDATTLLAALRSAAGALRSGAPRSLIQLTRRELVMSSLVSAFALVLGGGCGGEPPPPAKQPDAAPPATGSTVEVTLHINGEARKLQIEPRVTLLDALREHIGLTGTKKGCDHGQCGACTVHVGGRRILSCLTLAITQQDRPITTIEGLAKGDALHPVQAAFLEHDGFQCGFCTPGQIMSAVALLHEGHARTDAEVREQMSGNLCRCGAYPNIVAAIQSARGKA